MICHNLGISPEGHLTFAGRDTVTLAKQYGTPLYLMDEATLRRNCRTYVTGMKEAFGENALPLLASKACSFRAIYRIAMEEGMGTDVVSCGEIYTAQSVGFPMDKVYFHGNNKTDADIAYAMDAGVGYFVADNKEEILAIQAEAKARGQVQKLLLRLTPGIDPHTYEAVATGKVDSKFGLGIPTGEAAKLVRFLVTQENLDLVGFHCHVGSQVFDSEVYLATAEIMLDFIAEMQQELGLITKELNLGGGYGVRYTEADPTIDIAANLREVASTVRRLCEERALPLPAIRMEPGRSIVADAGLTLYTVGSVKEIPDMKTYVSVDGGMADNPRYALYRSAYTVCVANRMQEAASRICSVVGRCCESGDILQEDVPLPAAVCRGDTLAVLTTGAYNYAMSSNYNRIPRPPVVMLTGDSEYIAVKRESFADVARNDM